MNLEFIGRTWDKILEFDLMGKIKHSLSRTKVLVTNIMPKIMTKSSYNDLLKQVEDKETKNTELINELSKLVKVIDSIGSELKSQISRCDKLYSENLNLHQKAIQHKSEADKYKYAIEDIRRSWIHAVKQRDELIKQLTEK